MDQNSKGTQKKKADCRPYRVEACSWIHWIGVDGTKAHKNEGNIDTKATILLLSLLLLLLLLLRVMVRVPMMMQKSQKSANALHQKETKTQFCCEFITG